MTTTKFSMTTAKCARCKKDIEPVSALEIDALHYCIECAEQTMNSNSIDEKKGIVQQEKKELVEERDAIEKRLELISEDDTSNIIVTTTDTIEGKTILNYLDIVSVQDIIFESISLDPGLLKANSDTAERIFRNRIELNLSKMKKRAYLAGADAIVGLHVDSSMDHQSKGEYMAAVSLKISMTGTAVQLTGTD